MITKKIRLVAILFFKNGNIVQSKLFKQHKIVGDPFAIVDRLSSWNADEVIYLNIRPELENVNRQDKSIKYKNNFEEIIRYVGKKAFMPLTVGGGIKDLRHVENYFKLGADKISINSQILENPNLINQCAKKYGSQALVASVDVRLDKNDTYQAYINGGKKKVNLDLVKYIKRIEELGAGELLINNIDRDGISNGYDIKLLKLIKKNTNLPIIFAGGVGVFDDFVEAINENIQAVAAGNIFHFTENSYYEAIEFLNKKNCNVRPPNLINYNKI